MGLSFICCLVLSVLFGAVFTPEAGAEIGAENSSINSPVEDRGRRYRQG